MVVVVVVEVAVGLGGKGPEPGSGGLVGGTGPEGSDVVIVAVVAGQCLGTSLTAPSVIVDHNISRDLVVAVESQHVHISRHVLTYPALTEWSLRS